eukprot:scaffold44_cov411-Prasinococcus_capsulatus_cf.AAC.41
MMQVATASAACGSEASARIHHVYHDQDDIHDAASPRQAPSTGLGDIGRPGPGETAPGRRPV